MNARSAAPKRKVYDVNVNVVSVIVQQLSAVRSVRMGRGGSARNTGGSPTSHSSRSDRSARCSGG